MSAGNKVASLGAVDEGWEPVFKESGLEFIKLSRPEEISKLSADCFLVDVRSSKGGEEITKIKSLTSAPILSLVGESVNRDQLIQLKRFGAEGYVRDNTPPEEVSIRIRSMLKEGTKERPPESRAAQRIWFQQKVDFKIFDRSYSAWSTTLSETGIFLHTNLSFPLYSILHLQFQLFDPSPIFKSEGVIVRQEVDGDVRGLGVMFQNLKGENVRLLESFLEIYRS